MKGGFIAGMLYCTSLVLSRCSWLICNGVCTSSGRGAISAFIQSPVSAYLMNVTPLHSISASINPGGIFLAVIPTLHYVYQPVCLVMSGSGRGSSELPAKGGRQPRPEADEVPQQTSVKMVKSIVELRWSRRLGEMLMRVSYHEHRDTFHIWHQSVVQL